MKRKNKKQTLYVIDMPAECRALEKLLHPKGYLVHPFASAREFLTADLPLENACLIIDLEIAGMAAMEFKEALLSRGRRMPMIVTTFSEDLDASEAVRNLGATAYFRKPIDGQALIDAIDWAIINSG